jgi:hypothetical protein
LGRAKIYVYPLLAFEPKKTRAIDPDFWIEAVAVFSARENMELDQGLSGERGMSRIYFDYMNPPNAH